MAVVDQLSSTLRLVLYDGDDLLTGKPIYVSKSFNNVKTNSNPEQLYQTALAFESLQERPLSAVERRDVSAISEA